VVIAPDHSLSYKWKKHTPDGDTITIGEDSNMLVIKVGRDSDTSYFCEISTDKRLILTFNTCIFTPIGEFRVHLDIHLTYILKTWNSNDAHVTVENVDETIISHMEYLLAIINQPTSKDRPDGKFQRHQAFKNVGPREFGRSIEVQTFGESYFGEDNVLDLKGSLYRSINRIRSENTIITNQYIDYVLFPELLTKMIMDMEKCSFDRATAIGYNREGEESILSENWENCFTQTTKKNRKQ
jgi:hypothetical protein